MNIEERSLQTNKLENKIYRFKFSHEINDILFEFSKIHQHDNRHQFKESWELLITEKKEILEKEQKRLNSLGYNGDCYDKMFKSARYYFRKKSTIKQEPKNRRKYIGTDRDILDSMDDHIHSNIGNDGFKPSDSYDSYILSHQNLILKEISRMKEHGFSEPKMISNKLKKAYKNRYFLIINAK